jgi:hypothetical protein
VQLLAGRLQSIQFILVKALVSNSQQSEKFTIGVGSFYITNGKKKNIKVVENLQFKTGLYRAKVPQNQARIK